jgi:hypothetical protein
MGEQKAGSTEAGRVQKPNGNRLIGNSIALPPTGTQDVVHADVPTIFEWTYEARREALLGLYEKSKRLQWNASTDIDWSIDVDRESLGANVDPDTMNAVLQPPRPMTVKEMVNFRAHRNGWMLSQFMHGEQGALLATARIVETVPWHEAKLYAAAQVADEARHVEVYRRYLTEKLELSYPVNPHLKTLLDEIIRDSRWDMTYLGMQIMVEGLALAAFALMNFTEQEEPLIQQITNLVMRDEARHVAFGVLSLQEIYREMSSAELREREDFVIEASVLMRDRLLMEEVWEPLGLPKKEWTEWSLTTPFFRGFRQILFSKIVPNLKKLGLLTPRVREKFAELGVLQFEDLPDSSTEDTVTMPPALAQFFAQVMLGGDPGAAPPSA